MTALFFILLAVLVIGGNAMILLRTANKPTIPGPTEPPAREDEDRGW